MKRAVLWVFLGASVACGGPSPQHPQPGESVAFDEAPIPVGTTWETTSEFVLEQTIDVWEGEKRTSHGTVKGRRVERVRTKVLVSSPRKVQRTYLEKVTTKVKDQEREVVERDSLEGREFVVDEISGAVTEGGRPVAEDVRGQVVFGSDTPPTKRAAISLSTLFAQRPIRVGDPIPPDRLRETHATYADHTTDDEGLTLVGTRPGSRGPLADFHTHSTETGLVDGLITQMTLWGARTFEVHGGDEVESQLQGKIRSGAGLDMQRRGKRLDSTGTIRATESRRYL